MIGSNDTNINTNGHITNLNDNDTTIVTNSVSTITNPKVSGSTNP